MLAKQIQTNVSFSIIQIMSTEK